MTGSKILIKLSIATSALHISLSSRSFTMYKKIYCPKDKEQRYGYNYSSQSLNLYQQQPDRALLACDGYGSAYPNLEALR